MNEDELYDLGYEPAYVTQTRERKLADELRHEIDVLRDQVLTLTAIIATAAPSLRRNEKKARWRDYGNMNCWRDDKYSVVVWPDESFIMWRCYYRNQWLKQGLCESWADAKACAFEAIRAHGWTPAEDKGKTTDNPPRGLGVEP